MSDGETNFADTQNRHNRDINADQGYSPPQGTHSRRYPENPAPTIVCPSRCPPPQLPPCPPFHPSYQTNSQYNGGAAPPIGYAGPSPMSFGPQPYNAGMGPGHGWMPQSNNHPEFVPGPPNYPPASMTTAVMEETYQERVRTMSTDSGPFSPIQTSDRKRTLSRLSVKTTHSETTLDTAVVDVGVRAIEADESSTQWVIGSFVAFAGLAFFSSFI